MYKYSQPFSTYIRMLNFLDYHQFKIEDTRNFSQVGGKAIANRSDT